MSNSTSCGIVWDIIIVVAFAPWQVPPPPNTSAQECCGTTDSDAVLLSVGNKIALV